MARPPPPTSISTFIPTSSSWLYQIEQWFRNLAYKRIRRGAFTSVTQLVDTIMS